MKHKDFESSHFDEIKAELLRLMSDPKCYAISTFGAWKNYSRVRLICRDGALWVSDYDYYGIRDHGSLSRRMKLSCFSRRAGNSAEHIAHNAAHYSKGESTLIFGWFK